MYTQEQEDALLKSAKSGDNKAFEELLQLNFIKSKSIIQKQFKLSYHDLQDIMQTTSLNVWKHFNDNRHYRSFYNWFFTIFKNETLNYLKTRNKIEQNELTNVNLSGNKESGANDTLVYLKGLDDILENTAHTFLEQKERIQQYRLMIIDLLSKLKEHHREIIQMIMIEGKTYKEAAALLQIPKGSVMSRLHYAKLASRKIINAYSKSNNIEFSPF